LTEALASYEDPNYPSRKEIQTYNELFTGAHSRGCGKPTQSTYDSEVRKRIRRCLAAARSRPEEAAPPMSSSTPQSEDAIMDGRLIAMLAFNLETIKLFAPISASVPNRRDAESVIKLRDGLQMILVTEPWQSKLASLVRCTVETIECIYADDLGSRADASSISPPCLSPPNKRPHTKDEKYESDASVAMSEDGDGGDTDADPGYESDCSISDGDVQTVARRDPKCFLKNRKK
jgi:hypothetical protein